MTVDLNQQRRARFAEAFLSLALGVTASGCGAAAPRPPPDYSDDGNVPLASDDTARSATAGTATADRSATSAAQDGEPTASTLAPDERGRYALVLERPARVGQHGRLRVADRMRKKRATGKQTQLDAGGYRLDAVVTVREADERGAVEEVTVRECRIRDAHGERLTASNVVVVVDHRVHPPAIVEGHMRGAARECIERALIHARSGEVESAQLLALLAPPGPVAVGDRWPIDSARARQVLSTAEVDLGPARVRGTGTVVERIEVEGVPALRLRWRLEFTGARLAGAPNVTLQSFSGAFELAVVLPEDPAVPALAMQQTLTSTAAGTMRIDDAEHAMEQTLEAELDYRYQPL